MPQVGGIEERWRGTFLLSLFLYSTVCLSNKWSAGYHLADTLDGTFIILTEGNLTFWLYCVLSPEPSKPQHLTSVLVDEAINAVIRAPVVGHQQTGGISTCWYIEDNQTGIVHISLMVIFLGLEGFSRGLSPFLFLLSFFCPLLRRKIWGTLMSVCGSGV